MGFPLTEAFWVNVRVHKVKTWVLVQPFERRVLSYTPDNAPDFMVEMGNIGQHYYRWRYAPAPDRITPSATAVVTGTATDSPTATPTTPTTPTTTAPVISGVRFGLSSDTTAALSFQTDTAATSRILFGTRSDCFPEGPGLRG